MLRDGGFMTEMMSFKSTRRKPAGWLEKDGVPVTGFVAGILADDRRQAERRELRRLDPTRGFEQASARRSFVQARVWALKVGFPSKAVEVAARVACELKVETGAQVLRADVEARLRVECPHLLETA